MSSKKVTKDNHGWFQAQIEAKRQIAAAENRLRALRRSLSLIQEKIRNGEPWPKLERDSTYSLPIR